MAVSHRDLAGARDPSWSLPDTGIDIIPCYIWRVRQRVYISTACAERLRVLDITGLISILEVVGV
jgi:hypothetical protein